MKTSTSVLKFHDNKWFLIPEELDCTFDVKIENMLFERAFPNGDYEEKYNDFLREFKRFYIKTPIGLKVLTEEW